MARPLGLHADLMKRPGAGARGAIAERRPNPGHDGAAHVTDHRRVAIGLEFLRQKREAFAGEVVMRHRRSGKRTRER
jgi:hypothetical protein